MHSWSDPLQKITTIQSITISNIKGISHKTFDVDLIPNKPSLLVAPNGFGKSSITAGFASMNAKRIELPKDLHHKGDETLLPSVVLRFRLDDKTEHTSTATHEKNEIAETFDVHVINSRLISKAKKLKIGGAPVVTAAIEVTPVVLIKNVPDRAAFDYNYAKARSAFGTNGKVLPNIGDLLRNSSLMSLLGDTIPFANQTQARITAAISAFCGAINSASGTALDILSTADSPEFVQLRGIAYLGDTVSILKNAGVQYAHDAHYFLAAIQISEIHTRDRAAFKKAVAYARYCAEKDAYETTFAGLKTTWKGIAPKEDKKAGLVIEFPKANQISNGERDIICFVALLQQAKLKFKKKQCLLIIDELFDYLDDANLVACQYYVSQMISEMKANGQQLFPLIMTHLSPGYFKNFCFSGQKVRYLSKTAAADRSVEQVIIKRSDNSIVEDVAKYFLHFHPGDKDLSAEFGALMLSPAIASSSAFTAHVSGQLARYQNGKSYDPVAVCCAVRILIEKTVYDKLDIQHQPDFLDVHKTSAKLEFATEKGVDVPEIFYMLGLIYNEAMHLRDNSDNFSPLASRLDNLSIKHMIGTCNLL
jgi:hypothetical protein